MNSFSDLTKQVHLIDDLILADMRFENRESLLEEAQTFNRHLQSTKHWFESVSWSNKKRYLLALLEEVRSGWTLSLVLKSIWNCRPKDAVLSANELEVWSSYDQVPVDHNRTAQPVQALAQVMKHDRAWFLSLEPEPQAIVLLDLLRVAGGPIMWAVMKRAQVIYEKYRDEQMHNLEECIVVSEAVPAKPATPVPEKGKTSPHGKGLSSSSDLKKSPEPGHAQRELEANLAAWTATIKTLRDSMKMEELEMIFKDGSTRKIWKVNRPKPEVIETVDFLQLLPAAVAKRILLFLPRAQLGDYARVNKYWAYLVDDIRAEMAARVKLDTEMEKLRELMLRHDTSMEVIAQVGYPGATSSLGATSAAPSVRPRQMQPSMRPSERSTGAMSFRRFLNENLTLRQLLDQKPIRNLAEMTERLDRRGAADEDLWNWCENTVRNVKKLKKAVKLNPSEGILMLGNLHFPCPLMSKSIEYPLSVPLCKDPTAVKMMKPGRNISNATLLNLPKQHTAKRYSLWTKDFSTLYPVFKVLSHQSPI